MKLDIQELEAELAEKTKDLETFVLARDLVRKRVREVADSSFRSELTPLPSWSGTDAVLGSLDLCIHAMERTIEEIKQLLKATKLDRPFRVIEGENNGNEG